MVFFPWKAQASSFARLVTASQRSAGEREREQEMRVLCVATSEIGGCHALRGGGAFYEDITYYNNFLIFSGF